MSKPRVRARRVAIALPTGVLLPGALRILGRSGVARLSATELGRKLLVERPAVRVVLVRPADVPAYVDHGAADLGIVGKDVLWESPGAHYELADLRFGGCRLVLAVPATSKLAGCNPATAPTMKTTILMIPHPAGPFFRGTVF